MGFRHVPLHLRRLFPTLLTWTIVGNDRRKNSLCSYFSNIFAGNFRGHGNSESDAFLSLALPAGVKRWVNIVSGALYTVIMILAIRGGWHFYIFYGLIEIVLTALIVWYAWTWPRQAERQGTAQ
jgi:hypothetical protein